MADTDDVNHSVAVKLLVNKSKNALQNEEHIQSWTDACCVFCYMRSDRVYVVLLRENGHSCDSMSKAYGDIKAAVIVVVILANVLSIFHITTLARLISLFWRSSLCRLHRLTCLVVQFVTDLALRAFASRRDRVPYYQQAEIRRLRENSWLYGLNKALIGVFNNW